jgi:hypothetical protein
LLKRSRFNQRSILSNERLTIPSGNGKLTKKESIPVAIPGARWDAYSQFWILGLLPLKSLMKSYPSWNGTFMESLKTSGEWSRDWSTRSKRSVDPLFLYSKWSDRLPRTSNRVAEWCRQICRENSMRIWAILFSC